MAGAYPSLPVSFPVLHEVANGVFFCSQGALVANYPWDGTQDKR